MATARDLVTRALRSASVISQGQTASSEDENDVFNLLNEMLSEWSVARWYVYALREYNVTSTGAQSYTFGPGGVVNTGTEERPDRLEYAFLRQLVNAAPNQVDYPLEILWSREDYSKITLKSLVSFSNAIYYQADYPLGVLYPYPVPQANIYALHLGVKRQLQQFANLGDTVVLPNPYFSAIRFNLASRVRVEYGRKELPGLERRAKAALRALIRANVQMPRLQMPEGLLRGGLYNVYSDTFY